MNRESVVYSIQISKKNDELRKSVPAILAPHKLVLTRSVASLEADKFELLLGRVRTYSDFNEDNDPWGEHDFGAIDFEGVRYFWKFDYYNPSFQYFQEDGVRALTIMEASEY